MGERLTLNQKHALTVLADGGELVRYFGQWWLFRPNSTRKVGILSWDELWELWERGYVQALPGTIGTVYVSTTVGTAQVRAEKQP